MVSSFFSVYLQEASFEYLEKESEIQCLETLDQLEIAFEQSVGLLMYFCTSYCFPFLVLFFDICCSWS